MTKFSWNDYQFLDLINYKEHEVDNLPNGVSISTMCCSAKIGSEINIENVQNYLQLNKNDILTVKMNDQKIRTLLEQKVKNKRKKLVQRKAKLKNFITKLLLLLELIIMTVKISIKKKQLMLNYLKMVLYKCLVVKR